MMEETPKANEPAYRIRPMTAQDHDAVFALSERLLIGVAPWVDSEKLLKGEQESIQECFERDDAAVYVAEAEDGRILGFVTIARSKSYTGDVQAYLGELVVAEDVEGKGLGKALMSAAEGWASDRGLAAVVLDTGAANSRARAFYERVGYAYESVRMTKRLD